MRIRKSLPSTLADWQIIIDRAGKVLHTLHALHTLARSPPRANRWSIYYPQPVRQVGMFQEYLYPGTNDLHFYRHASTGACYFDKPVKMALLDQLAFHEQEQILRYG